jgi:ATP-dependent DNA helicase RecG
LSPVEEQVQKILLLEKAKGLRDRAVLGGLDRYLKRLVENHSLGPQSALLRSIAALPSRGYASLDTARRRRWIETALGATSGDGEGTSQQGPAARPTRPAGRRPAAPRAGARKRPSRVSPPAPPEEQAPGGKGLEAPVTVLRGVRQGQAAKFARLGVSTVRDALYFFPRRHNDFAHICKISELAVGEEQTVIVTVWSAEETRIGRRIRGTEAWVADETGMMRVVWFNQPYLARQLRTDAPLVLSGRVSVYKGQKTLDSPEWELLESEDLVHTGRLVPVYPLTSGLPSRTARRIVRDALDTHLEALPDPLPEGLRQRRRLWRLRQAVRQMHYPDGWRELNEARRRLAFDELLVIQIGVLRRRRLWQEGGRAQALQLADPVRRAFLESLPFQFTGAQQRAMESILGDLAQERPMSRLLQGDVGSGKTVVAAAGLLAAVASGCQGVLMAPTEILAEQHYRTLCDLLGGGREIAWEGVLTPPYLERPLRIALLTGSLSSKEKAAIHRQAAEGDLDVAVGTHALIQQQVGFHRLGMAVVDEQHRFGVMQRAALRGKGPSPHLLVMTATPIPRTLALTLYGDLDISVIDEMPPGRKPVKTLWTMPHERNDAYRFVREQADQGRQAFVICPLIEESEAISVRAATQEYERLSREVFPHLRLGLLHGRLPSAEKDRVMRAFRDHDLDILVSTAVVEVGIDVPNATVMMVEGADRFGLSQLHQFRGRVGRGTDQSYCLLLSDDPSEEAQERLRLMERTQDGFALAEADLRLRGPGEFFGTRQSGMPDLKVARLSDVKLIEEAREEAGALLDADPELSDAEHALLAAEAARLWSRVVDEPH